jgi:hypothetical protein
VPQKLQEFFTCISEKNDEIKFMRSFGYLSDPKADEQAWQVARSEGVLS